MLAALSVVIVISSSFVTTISVRRARVSLVVFIFVFVGVAEPLLGIVVSMVKIK